jgi:hypothetical protein
MKDTDRIIRSISINDNIYFHGIVDVLNECFGKNYRACYKSFIPMDDLHQAWFPKMAVTRSRQLKASPRSQGWLNYLTDDGKKFIEEGENDNRPPIEGREALDRYIFGYIEAKGYYPYTGQWLCYDDRYRR